MKAKKEFVNRIYSDARDLIKSLDIDELDLLSKYYSEIRNQIVWQLYDYIAARDPEYYKEQTKELKDSHLWTALRKAFNLDSTFKESYTQ